MIPVVVGSSPISHPIKSLSSSQTKSQHNKKAHRLAGFFDFAFSLVLQLS